MHFGIETADVKGGKKVDLQKEKRGQGRVCPVTNLGVL